MALKLFKKSVPPAVAVVKVPSSSAPPTVNPWLLVPTIRALVARVLPEVSMVAAMVALLWRRVLIVVVVDSRAMLPLTPLTSRRTLLSRLSSIVEPWAVMSV